ncbi:tetratricopeptide repeat protein, partial [candidate division KSB1 bacterium]|nr:tetratricopeptide repeat protein [candidate division KSB1 bacterium]NIR70700.1 tetratricopeptide repeat protein [candidate division KSB1 bacterium]NIS23156.1 tetratricopeptide repeat protein [candidate division KSB1 bacterium]NIT70017.1 tetratricopeptide repeat protein [candidate division KSB1 bacterium]NIU23654.1 tetratricopeptide repeat protein [candidate division KSB1 bacterium]
MSAEAMESFERFSNHPLLLLAIKVQNGELSLGEAFNQACQRDFLINLDSEDIEFLNEEILRYSQQNLTYYEDSPFAAMYFAVAGLNYRVSKARFNRLLARSAITFGLQMQRFNQFDKAIELYLEALDNLSEQEKQIAPMVYNYLGTAYHSTFEFANAVGYYKKSVETARALDDQYWASIALGNLGVAYQDSGDNRSALACYQEGLELSRELKTPWSIAQKLESIGSIYREQGYVDKAIEHFEESLSIAREMGDRRGVASLLNKLGTAHANTGNMKQAVNYLSESLQILASGINDPRMLSSVMSNLGGVLKDQGATRKARELFEQSLELARQADDQRGEADVLCNMASAHYAHGEHAQALAQSEEALKIYQKIGDRQGEAVCLGNMAVVRLDMNQAEATIEMCDQALKIVREIGDPWGEAAHLTVLANAYLVVGSFEEAIHHFQQALTIAERIGDLKTASECWTDLGLTARTQDELDKAEECYHKGLELSEQIGDRRNQIRDLVNLGVVHHLQRDHLAAGERFQEALHMSREVADSWSETSCLINLGLISARASKTELALDYYDQAIKIAKAKNYVEHLYRSYHGLGILYRNSDLEQSYKYFAQAIETLEGLRAGFSDPEFKMGFLREKESSFETMVDLLITLPPETAQRLKIDAEKELFHYIEMAKSKVLLDLLGSPRFRMTDLDQQDPDVLQEKKLRQDLDA